MRDIREIREQIKCYEEVLAELQKPFRTAQEETAVQLFSRLLFDASSKLKKLERGAVKLHYGSETEGDRLLEKKHRISIGQEIPKSKTDYLFCDWRGSENER